LKLTRPHVMTALAITLPTQRFGILEWKK